MSHARSLDADDADAALMARIQADEPGAFGVLYDRFGSRALRLAKASTRDASRAEDIVQEAFLSVWRGRARYQPGHGSVAGWILGVVRNRAIDVHRTQARHDAVRADEHHLDDRCAAGSLEEAIGERDEAARLRATLARLPAAQRDVIALAYFGELTAAEIAEELSLPLGTVKGRMRLGLDKLRRETGP